MHCHVLFIYLLLCDVKQIHKIAIFGCTINSKSLRNDDKLPTGNGIMAKFRGLLLLVDCQDRKFYGTFSPLRRLFTSSAMKDRYCPDKRRTILQHLLDVKRRERSVKCSVLWSCWPFVFRPLSRPLFLLVSSFYYSAVVVLVVSYSVWYF